MTSQKSPVLYVATFLIRATLGKQIILCGLNPHFTGYFTFHRLFHISKVISPFYSAIWHSVIWHSVICHSVIWHSAIWHSAIPCYWCCNVSEDGRLLNVDNSLQLGMTSSLSPIGGGWTFRYQDLWTLYYHWFWNVDDLLFIPITFVNFLQHNKTICLKNLMLYKQYKILRTSSW